MKFIKKIATILMIFIISITALANIVSAKNIPTSAELYSIDDVPPLLRYAEVPLEIKYVFHKYNGADYPAYCLNPELPGITGTNTYDIDGEITDNMVWKIIVNGYPYKSVEELGCTDKMEAYAATQYAIYSYKANNLEGYDFAAINESGKIVYEALKNILTNAQSSKVILGENNKIYYGKAPNGSLQNYALTGIVEQQEEEKNEEKPEEKVEEKVEEKPVIKTEEKKLPKTGM